MGTGYTRNDTANNIADGNVIDAADLDGEFDAVEAAFNSSTGHTHDGTSAEGGAITVLGPSQEFVATANEVRPSTNGGLSLGTNLVQFNNLYASGTISLGTSTFSDDVTFTGTNYNVVWDKSDNALEFADSAKAVFGAGSDLQIYHDGSNSYVSDGGEGDLKIRGANVRIENPSGSRYFQGSSGVAYLYNSGNIKLSTTSTGISVTDDIDVANNIIMSSDAANISFGADSEIYIKHVADTGLALENTNTGDNQSFVLNLKSNEDTLTAGEQIARINFSTNSSAGGVAAGTQATIRVEATGTYSSTVAGSIMEFYTTDTAGTNTRAMYIDDDQSVVFTGGTNVKLDATNDTLDFPDNFKIMMGAGDDLQIYHDGSGSYIDEVGTGPLKIRTDSFVGIYNTDETETIATFADDGAVRLYYDNTERFSTTSTGIDVTGSAFNFNGTAAGTALTIKATEAGAGNGPVLKLYRDSASPAADDDIGRIDFVGENSAGSQATYARIDTFIETPTSSSEDGRMRMLIESSGALQSFIDLDASQGGSVGRILLNQGNNDIDTVIRGDNDSNLLYADASTNRIGIGTDTPNARLEVEDGGTSAGVLLKVTADDAGPYAFVIGNDNFSTTDTDGFAMWTGNDGRATLDARGTGAYYAFRVEGTERVRINNDGKVGIGIQNAKTMLDIAAATPRITLTSTDQTLGEGSVIGGIEFYNSDASGNGPNSPAIIEGQAAGTLGNNGDLVFKTKPGSGEGSDALESVRIDHNGRVGIGTSAPDDVIHIVTEGSNDGKIILENTASPRGNYIGFTGSDNLVISADADNAGTDSMIQFHVDNTEHVRINHTGALLVNQTGDYSATNAPPAFIQSVGSSTGTSMMLGRNDTTVGVGDNVGAYLFRTADSSGVKYGGMVSRGRNTTGDAYLGFYSVDNRLEAGSSPDLTILENMNTYLRNGSFILNHDIIGGTYTANEDAFIAYHNGSGTGDTYVEMRVRDGTGGDPVWRHFRRGVLKSEIEENGDFLSATNSYGGTSDERLKENIVASGSQWDDIKALQIKKYSMIEDGLDAPNKLGVIAQDLMASGMNGLVTQTFKTRPNPETQEHEPVLDADGNQEEYYTVKYSILYMKAIKALQEAMERIETLETEQAAIKARLDALEAT